MTATLKNLLLTLLALALLCGFALAIPSGTLTLEARQRYLDSFDFASDEDVFVFEDDDELIFFEE